MTDECPTWCVLAHEPDEAHAGESDELPLATGGALVTQAVATAEGVGVDLIVQNRAGAMVAVRLGRAELADLIDQLDNKNAVIS